MQNSDQHSASDPNLSVWVSANAGTGKTKVLTDRVLRLLLNGNKPDKILCITYTKAAAAEMEHRIKSELAQWSVAEDIKLKDTLAKLIGQMPDKDMLILAKQLFHLVLDAPQGIRIQTIHSFCQSLLARFPLEADIAPHFTLIDELTSREMLAEAKMRLLQDAAPATTQAVAALAIKLHESSLEELLKEIASNRSKFNRFFEAYASDELVKKHIYSQFQLAKTVTLESLLKKHFHYLEQEKNDLLYVVTCLAEGKETNIKTSQKIARWLSGHAIFQEYLDCFLTAECSLRKSIYTKDKLEQFPAIEAILHNEKQRVLGFYSEYRALMTAEATCQLLTIAKTFLSHYQQLKTYHAAMDYDDLIHHSVALLTNKSATSWILYKLDGGIDHLLLDEAQDTSPEQWSIIRQLIEEFLHTSDKKSYRTFFVVGDEKQSIYSFQGANPSYFDTVQQQLSIKSAQHNYPFKRVRLNLSYRSTTPVLQAVDTVFALPAAKEGLLFSENEISHTVFRKEAAGRVEIWPLEEATKTSEEDPWTVPTFFNVSERADILLANRIALVIQEWLHEKRILASKGRPVAPEDILILVQQRGRFADSMIRALKRHNVPVAGADRLVLTEHIAVMDLMALGDFLLLPQDDLNLATVLKSPLIGHTEEDLFELAHGRGNSSLWQQLQNNEKFSVTKTLLTDLLGKTDFISPHKLFSYILDALEGRRKLARRLGSEIHDPLDEFLSLTLQYEKSHSNSLQGFLHWLREGATEIKRDMEQDVNAVRLMTVHASKGLQAPKVFLADTQRTPRYNRGILYTDELVNTPVWSAFAKEDDDYYTSLKNLQRHQAECEYRRLLYVAMTRAADELYICGWKTNKNVSEKSWYELIKKAVQDQPDWVEVDDKKILISPQTTQTSLSQKTVNEIPKQPLPLWIHAPIAREEKSLKPLTPSEFSQHAPSKPSTTNVRFKERGILIHRLLQYLPGIEPELRPSMADRLIERYGKALPENEKIAIKQEIDTILNHEDYHYVFSANSFAEVPITGRITINNSETIVSGQIDRLAVLPHDVYIVDYKTSQQVPSNVNDVPQAYLKQMQAYHTLVASIYPDKTIHSAILWTNQPLLMILPSVSIDVM